MINYREEDLGAVLKDEFPVINQTIGAVALWEGQNSMCDILLEHLYSLSMLASAFSITTQKHFMLVYSISMFYTDCDDICLIDASIN